MFPSHYIFAGLVAFVLFMGLFAWLAKVPITYNLRNLMVRWQVTLMMVLAFVLQVGVLIFMFAFVNGMYRLTEESGVPGNVIVLSDGATDEVFSNLGYSDTSDVERHPGVLQSTNPNDPGPMASWEVYILVNQPIPPERVNGMKLGGDFVGDSMKLETVTWGGVFASGNLKPGDTLLKLDNISVSNHDLLQKLLAGKLVGKAAIEIDRNGSVIKTECDLDKIAPTGSTRRFLQVRGIDNPTRSLAVHNLELRDGGKVFGDAGVRGIKRADGTDASAWEVILGEGIARTLASDLKKSTLEPGDTFIVADRSWVVAGVMKSAGSTFDSEIWAKRTLVGPLFGKNAYSTVVLRTADAEAAASVASDLTSTFKKAAVQATPEKEYFARLNSTNQQFLVSILFVAFVVLIGGSLGMMNAMFAAISSRIKDIGVLRIIGFAPWQVLFSFLLEALLLSLIGGVLGCAAGMLADGWSANSIVSGGAGGGKSVVLKMTVDGQLLVFGLLFSLTIGLIGGLVPAFSAMFIKPLDALR